MSKTITVQIPEKRLNAKFVRPARSETVTQDDAGRWTKIADEMERLATGEEQIPLTECLKDTVARVLPLWTGTIAPRVKAGERVITEGADRLTDGAEVQLATDRGAVSARAAIVTASTGVLGSSSRTFYVSQSAVYVWTSGLFEPDRRGRAAAAGVDAAASPSNTAIELRSMCSTSTARKLDASSASVTGRIGDIRHPEKGNGCVVVDGVLYRLFEAGNTINPVTKRPNAIWQLIPEQPAAPVKLPDNGVQIQMPL